MHTADDVEKMVVDGEKLNRNSCRRAVRDEGRQRTAHKSRPALFPIRQRPPAPVINATGTLISPQITGEGWALSAAERGHYYCVHPALVADCILNIHPTILLPRLLRLQTRGTWTTCCPPECQGWDEVDGM